MIKYFFPIPVVALSDNVTRISLLKNKGLSQINQMGMIIFQRDIQLTAFIFSFINAFS
jgi:hypothetical protein